MPGLWYPYKDGADALRHLSLLIKPQAGISYSDGRSISVLRKPVGNEQLWLNVLARHVSVRPPAPKPAPPTAIQRFEHWVGNVVTAIGEAEMRNEEAQMEADRATAAAFDHYVWQPTHQFLLRHKLVADFVGVAADAVGVVAGVAFVIFVAPEATVAAAVIGTAAAVGSIVLLAIDGTTFYAEFTGNKALQDSIENDDTLQWARIIATLATLPDMAVGGVTGLKNVPRLSKEAAESMEASRAASAGAEAQRARAARIAHPAKHMDKVNKHLAKANRLAKAAAAQATKAQDAAHELRMTVLRDLPATYGATPLGAALMAGAPPGQVLSREQREADERLMKQIAPEGGMPPDVRLEMRISALASKL